MIFTKLSFLTVKRLAGDSEKSVSFHVSQFSELWRCYQTVTLFSRILCECSWIFQAFCWIGRCPGFNCILNFICFLLSLFWVFLPFCQVCSRRNIFVPPLLMAFLNFRQQFHINSGVIFFFAVKTFSAFFSVQLFLKVFTPIWVYCWLHFNLTSFLIATWCLFRIFCIFQVLYFLRCQGKYWSGIWNDFNQFPVFYSWCNDEFYLCSSWSYIKFLEFSKTVFVSLVLFIIFFFS